MRRRQLAGDSPIGDLTSAIKDAGAGVHVTVPRHVPRPQNAQ
jgi:hypothetical protein